MRACYLLLALVAGAAADCQMSGPLDLGRALSTEVLRINVHTQFTAGEVQHGVYYGVPYTNNHFCTGEHIGTHLDAPFHISPTGWKLEEIPLERLIANGVFLNVTAEVAGNTSFRLQPSHIDAWIERNGPFPDNAILLISYGWAQRFHNHTLFAGSATDNFEDFDYPGISNEAVDRLLQIPQLVGFGIDTLSVDPPRSAYAHQMLATRNIYNLEQVDLDQPCLPEKGFKVYTMPTKIKGGTGAPTRIIAVPNCPA